MKDGEFFLSSGTRVKGIEILSVAKCSDTQSRLVRGTNCKLWTKYSFSERARVP